MVGVRYSDSQNICKYGRGFLKGDSMFALIAVRFVSIPFEFKSHNRF